jgi:hypothetical protein
MDVVEARKPYAYAADVLHLRLPRQLADDRLPPPQALRRIDTPPDLAALIVDVVAHALAGFSPRPRLAVGRGRCGVRDGVLLLFHRFGEIDEAHA